MPLAGPVLGTTIFRYFTSFGFTGAQASSMAMACGNGIVNNLLATNFYTGTTIGTGPGPGSGTGKLIGLVGPVVGQNIATFMAASGFTGAQMINTANAIGLGVAEHVTAFGIVTAVGGPTAIGTGTGPLVGVVGPIMGQMIFTFMTAAGFTGAQALSTAMAVGNGVALSMSAALVQTTIVGVPAPPPVGPFPSMGVETGKLT